MDNQKAGLAKPVSEEPRKDGPVWRNAMQLDRELNKLSTSVSQLGTDLGDIQNLAVEFAQDPSEPGSEPGGSKLAQHLYNMYMFVRELDSKLSDILARLEL